MLATSSASSRSRHTPLRNALAALMLLAWALAGSAAAQGSPAISLDSFNYRVGDTLRVSASGLRPGGSYLVALSPPEDAEAEGASLQEQADAAGAFQAELPLTADGRWTLSVTGPDLDATLNVQVAGAVIRLPTPGEPAQTAPSDEPVGQTEPEEPADEPVDAPADTPADIPSGTQGEVTAEGAVEETVTEPAEEPEAAPVTPTPTPAEPPVATPAAVLVTLENDEFVARSLGVEIWRLSFPAGSGAGAGPVVIGDRVYLGRGNHLLTVDAETGSVLRRFRLPAQIVSLDAAAQSPATSGSLGAPAGSGADDGLIEATVQYASGARQAVSVNASGPAADLAFDPDPALYGWLRAEAQVDDPVARLLVDPTNPWLYLAAASQEPSRATNLLNGALAQAETFYERAQVARQLMSGTDRRPDLASQAMDAALEDFVTRGYRGTLLFDEAASAAYGFPLDAMRTALARGDMQAADFWAPWLYRLSGSAVPANEGVLRDYADELRRLGRDSEANTWRQRAGEGHRFTIAATVRDAAVALGRSGWLAVAALLVAILALVLTLSAKYWRPQSLLLKQTADRGGRVPRFARLNVVRHASLVEKFVIVLLFASVFALAGLHGWTTRAGGIDAALGTGTLATPVARAELAALTDNGAAAFVDAFAAHTSGDLAAASRIYQELTTDADAMNNLGVLRGDPELYRVALELRGDHPEASFNLGLSSNPSRLLDAYRPDAAQLAAPDQRRLEDAFAGSYRAALGAAFTDPWTTLTSDAAFGPQWLWVAAVVAFMAWAAVSVIWLLIPRPRTSRNAPRTPLYHLLALLFPGTGLADELWGVLLLVPWAIFGTDLLRRYFLLGSGPVIGAQVALIAIIVIYAVNLIAFIVEYRSYRGRMARLRVDEPEIARAYGMKVDDGPRV